MSRDEIIPIGRITGAHGIRGEVKLLPYCGLGDFVWQGMYVVSKDGLIPCKVATARLHKESYILAIEGCGTREEAEAMAGAELAVAKASLPPLPKGEYYGFELIGAEVWTEDGALLGRITGIMPTGANDVFEVSCPGGEMLIPVIEQTILSMDAAASKVIVRLMEGLEPVGKAHRNE
ncbi:MAG: 16S rRNA processing protein RimM [Deltaproteobacteria bacterium]|nr:16S rRNA processing protein RimM [Deltaproteobacteria bacterium]